MARTTPSEETAFYHDTMRQYDPANPPTQQYAIISRLARDDLASPAEAVARIQSIAMAHVTNHSTTPNTNNSNSGSSSDNGTWPVNTFQGDFIWQTISLVMDIAANTPPVRQAKLLEFMLRLQGAPVIDPRTGDVVKYLGERIFYDLPSLGSYVSDFFSFAHDQPPSPSPDELRDWENKTAFLAQLTHFADIDYTSPNSTPHPMDYTHIGFYAIRDAFEEETDDYDGLEYDGDENGIGKTYYESAVRIACIWFVYAAERLWENCKHRRAVEQQPNGNGLASPGLAATTVAVDGFHVDRWWYWKRCLRRVERVFATQGTRRLVHGAMAQVCLVERG